MFNKRNNFNKIVVNGKSIECSGSNICVRNGKVIVDGKIVQADIGYDIKVTVYGDVNKLDCAGSVEVHGNCGSIDCSGSCKVGGDVNGKIDASGSVTCGNVSGDIDCSGSIRCKR